MEIIKVLDKDKAIKGSVELCSGCGGDGFTVVFDGPYDQDEYVCKVCCGSGRTTQIKAHVILKVPYNPKKKSNF